MKDEYQLILETNNNLGQLMDVLDTEDQLFDRVLELKWDMEKHILKHPREFVGYMVNRT
jgi:hypothetical protein